jgi:hypothetical protein
VVLLGIAAAPALAGAQGNPPAVGAQSLTVTVVIAGTQVPLGNSVVDIPALRYERFADDGGRVVIAGVPPGTYQVRVRHIGYVPREVGVVVSDTSPAAQVVELTRIAVQLAGITVGARRPCTAPGLPSEAADSSLSAVATVLQQVGQNAAQFRLLSTTYPFAFDMARTFGTTAPNGASKVVRRDTIRVSSEAQWHYEPHEVVGVGRDPRTRGLAQSFHVPTLLNFAEAKFQETHCFDYAGVEVVDGHALTRVDFRPPDRFDDPDIEGSVYLDTATYQIVRLTVSLTHIETLSQGGGLVSATVTASFGQLAPSISTVRLLESRNARRSGGGVTIETEDQRIIRIWFLNDTPLGVRKLPP